jgi:hypothetical protein
MTGIQNIDRDRMTDRTREKRERHIEEERKKERKEKKRGSAFLQILIVQFSRRLIKLDIEIMIPKHLQFYTLYNKSI